MRRPLLALRARAWILALLLAGCEQQKMAEQPAYKTFDPSDFFGDRRSARPLVADTVARGQLRDDTLRFTGRRTGVGRVGGPGGAPAVVALGEAASPFADEFPFPVTQAVLRRGRERFNIFCSVCHGYTGQGNGKIVERGYTKPPSYHEERLVKAPAGYFFDVITRGYGAMPDYRSEVMRIVEAGRIRTRVGSTALLPLSCR